MPAQLIRPIRIESRSVSVECVFWKKAASIARVRASIMEHGNVAENVTTTLQAADILLNRWPSQPGAKHLAARKACLKVLEGLAEARAARQAFEAAAKEADVWREPLRPVVLDSEGPKLRPRRKLKRDL